MARIKIKDLPQDQKVGKEEMKNILGGMSMGEVQWRMFNPQPEPPAKDMVGSMYIR